MIAERFQSCGLQREDSALIEAAAASCTNQHSGHATAPFSSLMFVFSTAAECVCMNPDFRWQTAKQRVQPVKIRIKMINKINTHAAAECRFIYTSCELWRFHLLRSEQRLLITNTFASPLPHSPLFYLGAPEYIQRWMFMHVICKFQSPRCTCTLNSKKERQTKKPTKLNKSLKSWTQFESSPAETHWGLQMQIKPAAHLSLRKGTHSFEQKYLWLMEMSSIFSWSYFFSCRCLDAFFPFFLRHHDNAASTSATTPLHGWTLGTSSVRQHTDSR